MTLQQAAILFIELLGAVSITLLMALNPRIKQTAPLAFKYSRREGLFALGLFAAAWVVALWVGQNFTDLTGLSGGQLAYSLVTAAAGLLIFAAALAYRRQPLRSAGWSRALLGPAAQLGIAVVLLSIFLRGKFSALIAGVSAEQGSALLMILAACLAQEFIFRGYIQLRLSAWWGPTWGWLASSLLFVLWLLPLYWPAGLAAAALPLAVQLAQSLLAGWMMQKSRHVLAPALYRAISAWLSLLG